VPKEYFPDVLAAACASAARPRSQRCGPRRELVECASAHTEYAIPTYYVVATAEASSNLARYDGVRYGCARGSDGTLQAMFAATREKGFGAEVKRRILLGTYVSRPATTTPGTAAR
jgi:aspartyl-tRNA(Asn)/glutamyl-tRNA(Gln) amidotransferase subunit A